MCFSAPVSFTASAVLFVTGGLTRKNAKKKYRLFALVPLMFGIQQLAEGLLWTVDKNSTLGHVLAYIFLFFAFIVWPSYIPIISYKLEPKGRRKDLLKAFSVIGTIVAAILLVTMLINQLDVQVIHKSIWYSINLPYYTAVTLAYVIAVLASLVISSDKVVRLFGALSVITAMIAGAFFFTSFISVWCLFCAASSLVLYFVVKE